MTEADAEKAAAPTRRDWIDLAVLSVGLGVIVLDGTIVAVSYTHLTLPTICSV